MWSADAELIAASLTDPSRFGDLYERYAPAVLRYLSRRLGAAGEDAAAETFVRAFRGRDRYQPENDTALPWLLGIAGHIVADHRRAEGRRLAALQRLAAATPVGNAEVPGELTVELVAQLRRLPAIDRDALLLVVWGELSYAEAASALGVPLGTVRSRINRARARMAAAVEPRERLPVTPNPQGGHDG